MYVELYCDLVVFARPALVKLSANLFSVSKNAGSVESFNIKLKPKSGVLLVESIFSGRPIVIILDDLDCEIIFIGLVQSLDALGGGSGLLFFAGEMVLSLLHALSPSNNLSKILIGEIGFLMVKFWPEHSLSEV